MVSKCTWQQAWEQTVTRANIFYRNNQPADHFTTSVMFSDEVANWLARTIQALDDGTELIVTDVGAGGAQLTLALADRLADRPWIQLTAIDLRAAPPSLPPSINWRIGDVRTISLTPARRVVVAHEFLDDIPCERFEVDEWGDARLIIVADGEAVMGPSLADDKACSAFEVNAPALRNWLDTWWPARRPYMRGEIGTTRDATWQHVTGWITSGLGIAIDYGHLLPERTVGTWDGGTLTGFRNGHPVTPMLDGSCNITAHVAMDAIAATRPDNDSTIRRQNEILRGGHVTKPGGLGDFLWLTQAFSRT